MDQAPLGYGRGSRTDDNTIVATFPMSMDFEGWHMAAAELDETGYFLTVTFKRA